MNTTNTGGPAFPHLDSDEKFKGMTLRDYFAAKAMQGFCAGAQSGDDIDEIPSLSYMLADEMLKARDKS